MLHITIFAIGKLKEPFWKDAVAEYAKRLEGYIKIDIKELPDSSPHKEAEALQAAFPKVGSAALVLLDIKGKETSSEQLAQKLEHYALKGTSHICFIIGGSDGVTAHIKQQATERISFGPITLPHNLARIVLLEQLYRACKINKGEPYHK